MRDSTLPSRRRRLDYVNHARRLAEGDWAGVESDEDGGEDGDGEEEMEVDAGRRLPKRYANQVRGGPRGAPGGVGALGTGVCGPQCAPRVGTPPCEDGLRAGLPCTGRGRLWGELGAAFCV